MKSCERLVRQGMIKMAFNISKDKQSHRMKESQVQWLKQQRSRYPRVGF